MSRTIINEMNVGYHQNTDYIVPNLSLNDETEYHIGVWGQRYRKHLQEHHKIIYFNYLTKGTLYEHLAEVDNRAETIFNRIVESLAEKENVTEKLKVENMMLWVQKMNNIRSRATEIVNSEVIFV